MSSVKPEPRFCLDCLKDHEPHRPDENLAWQWSQEGHALRSPAYVAETDFEGFKKAILDVILDDVPHKYQKRLLKFFEKN